MIPDLLQIRLLLTDLKAKVHDQLMLKLDWSDWSTFPLLFFRRLGIIRSKDWIQKANLS